MRPPRPAFGLLRPVTLRFHADFHLRSQHSSIANSSVAERVRVLREFAAQMTPGGDAAREAPGPQAPSRRVTPADVRRHKPRRIEPLAIAAPRVALQPRSPHATREPRGPVPAASITHILARQTALRVREASRRQERRDHPRIQLRTPARPAPRADRVEAIAAETSPDRTPSTAAWMPATQAVQNLPIELIADQVIGQLDRRLTAHRERMGRV
ncbi:MAG: hypothetical protein ACRD44_10710 [Bryobacteraceae bacterium]